MGRSCNASRLKAGDKFSRISYGEVVSKQFGEIRVRNEDGFTWSIGSNIVEKEFTIADQYEKTEKVTRTQMVDLIKKSARVVMSITFRKKPEHKDLVDAVEMLITEHATKKIGRRTLSAQLKVATAGKERTIVGRHTGAVDDFGRICFTDMEAADGRLRTVDPRTVDRCIIENVCYEVKG